MIWRRVAIIDAAAAGDRFAGGLQRASEQTDAWRCS
jgi:hypothetical protein